MTRTLNKLPPQKVLQRVFNYCPETGVFTWRTSLGGRSSVGQEVGWLHRSGYVYIGLHGQSHKAHRLAWKYVYGKDPNGLIDHIDRDKTNNRIANLRIVSDGESNQNKATYRNNRSGHKGVGWYARRKAWRVRIQHDKRVILVGFFPTIEHAIAARNAAEQQWHACAKTK